MRVFCVRRAKPSPSPGVPGEGTGKLQRYLSARNSGTATTHQRKHGERLNEPLSVSVGTSCDGRSAIAGWQASRVVDRTASPGKKVSPLPDVPCLVTTSTFDICPAGRPPASKDDVIARRGMVGRGILNHGELPGRSIENHGTHGKLLAVEQRLAAVGHLSDRADGTRRRHLASFQASCFAAVDIASTPSRCRQMEMLDSKIIVARAARPCLFELKTRASRPCYSFTRGK